MQIKSTKDITPTRINCLIYGNAGVGKTTLAGTLPGKSIIISLEAGLLSLRDKDIDFIEIKSIPELKDALTQVSKSDYDNVFIDSLSEIASLFVEYATKEYPDDRQTMKKWGYYSEMITKFIKYTRDLDKNIFYTALEKVDKDEIGRRFSLPDFPGSIAHKCPAFFDLVFNMVVFEKEGEKVRALATSGKNGAVAKDRSGKLKEYEKPDLGLVISKIFNKG